jgi:hypothetical protein
MWDLTAHNGAPMVETIIYPAGIEEKTIQAWDFTVATMYLDLMMILGMTNRLVNFSVVIRGKAICVHTAITSGGVSMENVGDITVATVVFGGMTFRKLDRIVDTLMKGNRVDADYTGERTMEWNCQAALVNKR